MELEFGFFERVKRAARSQNTCGSALTTGKKGTIYRAPTRKNNRADRRRGCGNLGTDMLRGAEIGEDKQHAEGEIGGGKNEVGGAHAVLQHQDDHWN